MHEYSDTEIRRQFDPRRPTGAEITVGSIARLSSAAGDTIAKIAKLNATIRDLDERLARIEAQAAPVAPRAVVREALA